MQITIPCHFCGEDNSIHAFECSRCKSVLRFRLRRTMTTRLLPDLSACESPEMKLAREMYEVSVLLMMSAHRLCAMYDKMSHND